MSSFATTSPGPGVWVEVSAKVAEAITRFMMPPVAEKQPKSKPELKGKEEKIYQATPQEQVKKIELIRDGMYVKLK